MLAMLKKLNKIPQISILGPNTNFDPCLGLELGLGLGFGLGLGLGVGVGVGLGLG